MNTYRDSRAAKEPTVFVTVRFAELWVATYETEPPEATFETKDLSKPKRCCESNRVSG
jgi:hypothetical protein